MHRFVMVDALATLDAPKESRFFLLEFLRYQNGNQFAHGLFGRIPEKASCAVVPTDDHTIKVGTHDRIIGRADDAGELLSNLLGTFPVANIKKRSNPTLSVSLLIRFRRIHAA